MSDYRLYFVDEKGAIQAREDFEAPDDDVALVVSDLVCRACSDSCSGYELWQDRRQVIAFDSPLSTSERIAILKDDQAAAAQEITLRVEESLQRSHWRIAHSEKLASDLELLKKRAEQVAPRRGSQTA